VILAPVSQSLRTHLASVLARIESARCRGPSGASSVRLVAVTKSVPDEILADLPAAGVTDVGENRVQSAQRRRPLAPAGLTWHGIGHLQRNKVARAVRLFDVFHALDSERLAVEIEAILANAPGRGGTNARWPVYIQVNAASDPAKGGVRPEETLDFVKRVSLLEHLEPVGFMTMAREGSSDAEARAAFRTLREVRDDVVRASVGTSAPTGLSMGMSDDFEVAVEEGATVVRVGRALFEGVVPDASEGAPEGAAR
jgi:pyridoxal phosphate enzyme (YggS family)